MRKTNLLRTKPHEAATTNLYLFQAELKKNGYVYISFAIPLQQP